MRRRLLCIQIKSIIKSIYPQFQPVQKGRILHQTEREIMQDSFLILLLQAFGFFQTFTDGILKVLPDFRGICIKYCLDCPA